jgi:hypothetical protein
LAAQRLQHKSPSGIYLMSSRKGSQRKDFLTRMKEHDLLLNIEKRSRAGKYMNVDIEEKCAMLLRPPEFTPFRFFALSESRERISIACLFSISTLKSCREFILG